MTAYPRTMGIDPSISAFGWALVRNPRNIDLVSGTIRAKDIDALIGMFAILLDEQKPDLVAFERALPYVKEYQKKQLDWQGNAQFTPNPAAFILHELQGAMRALLVVRGIRYLVVAPETWRAAILGKGPMKRDKAKAMAKAYVDRIGIKERMSVDACEAVCIGLWACSTIEYRYMQSVVRD